MPWETELDDIFTIVGLFSRRPSWNLNPNIIPYTEWCYLKGKKLSPFACAKSPCKFWLDNVLKFLLTLPSPLTWDWNFNCVNYILTSRLFNKVSARKLDWTKKESFIKKTMSFFPNLRDFILKAVLCVTISIVKNNWSTICVYPLSVTTNLLFNFNNI